MIVSQQHPEFGKIKRLHTILLIFLFILLSACNRNPKTGNPAFQNFSIEKQELHQGINAVSAKKIQQCIDSLRLSDNGTYYMDKVCNNYYAERKPYLWIQRSGVNYCCDTLLQWIEQEEIAGIPSSRFYLKIIKENLARLRKTDFDKSKHTASRTLAFLEYYLTKSYFRYAYGQRYGYTNPYRLFGKGAYDVPTERPNDEFNEKVVSSVQTLNMHQFLTEIQPHSELYTRLVEEYHKEQDLSKRKKLAINIERARWRMAEEERDVEVIVNVPAQEVYAKHLKGDSSISMKICYGAVKTKTPLLRSTLTHLELNPYWTIPPSIVKGSISAHASDSSYMARHRYEVVDRSTGKIIPRGHASSSAMYAGKYIVRQERGEGNSLGRIIFRFPNNFSVYMHDTNNRNAFLQGTRAVSHGCIRLEKPYAFAQFLLGHKGEEYMGNIWEAIHYVKDTTTVNITDASKDKEKKTMPTGQRKFDNKVDLWITYFTCFPHPESAEIRYYRDIYTYDSTIAAKLF